jgi:hypothetical protein
MGESAWTRHLLELYDLPEGVGRYLLDLIKSIVATRTSSAGVFPGRFALAYEARV